MKKNAGPVVIAVAGVALVGLLVVLYMVFFPPPPPPDTANPNHMPAYAKAFLKNRKEGGGGSMPKGPGGSMGGGSMQAGGGNAPGR